MSEVVAAQHATREVELHRRVAVITPTRIDIRPSRRALRGPLIWLLLGVAAFAGIAVGRATLPLPALALLLLLAVVAIPLAGIGVVYGLIGAHVIFDAAKGSATWQQGMIGLGIGTEELVPFAKIAAITVEEAGDAPQGSGAPTEELAQWQIVLEKTSGRRLVIAGVTVARSRSTEALERVAGVASALAALTGAPLRLPGAPAPVARPEPAIPAPKTATRRPRQRRRRR